MANLEVLIPTAWVKMEPIDGPIDTHQSNRERVGEIYRLAPNHLAFVCAHCDEEFPLLIQFTAHIQSHLIEIHADYIEPKHSPTDECCDIFGDGDACSSIEETVVHRFGSIEEKPTIVRSSTVGITADNGEHPTSVELNNSPQDEEAGQSNLQQCPTCQKQFKSLVLHLRFAQQCNPSVRTYECYLCRCPFKSKKKCKQHVQKVHTGAMQQCPYCGENICRNSGRHRKACGPMNSFRCEHCPFSFHTEGQLKAHGRKRHGLKPNRKFRCKLCEQVLRDRTNWVQHMRDSHSNAMLKCARCDGDFATRTDLLEHAIACAGESCICRICPQTFSDQAAKALHMQSHQKCFQCDECGRQFKTKMHLTVHQYSHSDVARFKCDECPKEYKYRTSLDSHKMSHRGVRPFECHLCTRNYFVKIELKRHLWRIHRITNDKRKLSEKFICKFCSMEYRTAYNLTCHMRRHTGDKLLQCSQCDFKCPIQFQLDKHKLSHSNRRDFQCDLCPKAFKQKDALVAHKRIHLGDFKFTCKWCSKGFHDNRIYKKHTLSAHGRRWDDAMIGDDSPKGHGQSSSSTKSNG